MTPGPSARRRKRRLLYKVKSSKARDGSIIYSCIFSCLDDVEHHRHRRNPFDPKYIQAALSSFDELIRDDCARIPTREEVEAASTSVHVRMELIKSMKDGLVKLTGEAVRCFRAVSKRSSNQRYAFDHEDKSHVLANGRLVSNLQPSHILFLMRQSVFQ
ncbi:hypothetical protein KP509_05G092700 [Ceratopteris richardii]|uniref:Uncharacterized protein n=1 Tax=Ceratopteris richardii TaxID=49495 RepID=A0A8T2UTC1_CERRI|nr:hypothetical protein KP509_05G092700 [Ceratopteris richardii]